MSVAPAPENETDLPTDVPDADTAADTESCVICLDPISERAVASPCQHAFDYLCLLNWLEVRQSCPLCKTTVEDVGVVNKTLGRVVKHPVEPSKTAKDTEYAPHIHHRTSHPSSSSRPPRPRAPDPPAITEHTALLRRRFIYMHHLRSSHIGNNNHSRFRNPTPSQFHHDTDLLSRARAFIRRELQVFHWIAADGNAEFLLEYIVGILKSVDLRGASGAAEDMISDFLGRENARVFIHELHAWLRSPFGRLADFDAFAQYGVVVPRGFDRWMDEPRVLEGDRKVEEDRNQGDDGVGRAPPKNRNNRASRKAPYDRHERSDDRERGYDSYRPSHSRA